MAKKKDSGLTQLVVDLPELSFEGLDRVGILEAYSAWQGGVREAIEAAAVGLLRTANQAKIDALEALRHPTDDARKEAEAQAQAAADSSA